MSAVKRDSGCEGTHPWLLQIVVYAMKEHFLSKRSKLASLGFDKRTVAGGWRVNLLERSVKETGAPPNQGRARTG